MGCNRWVAQAALCLFFAGILTAAGCGSKGTAEKSSSNAVEGDKETGETTSQLTDPGLLGPSEYVPTTWPGEEKTPPKPKPNLRPVVVIKTSLGEITVKLNAEKSPVTVDNFLDYVNKGFYEETVFHYVDKGNLIAAGGYTSELEAKEAGAQLLNEATNGLKNRRGTIAMARHPDYSKSATSQFFFNLVDNPALDHQGEENDEEFGYCVFGEVTDGLDVIDRIAEVPVSDEEDFPKVPATAILIESVRVLR